MKKIDIILRNHFLCKKCTKERRKKVIFFNDDDNVCPYCGSKNTIELYKVKFTTFVD